jgi:hypothetical protein
MYMSLNVVAFWPSLFGGGVAVQNRITKLIQMSLGNAKWAALMWPVEVLQIDAEERYLALFGWIPNCVHAIPGPIIAKSD